MEFASPSYPPIDNNIVITATKSTLHKIEGKLGKCHRNRVPRMTRARLLRRLRAVDANLNLPRQSLIVVLVKRPSHLPQRPPRLSPILKHIHPGIRILPLHQYGRLCVGRRLLLRDGAQAPVGQDVRCDDAQRGRPVVELDAGLDEARGVGAVAVGKGEHEAALVVERLPGRGDGDLHAGEARGGDGGVEVGRCEVVLARGWAPDVGVGGALGW
ncbi:uncharacterized protein TrAtP1_004490 [Trichoderma atroviride]|uniref:uncharacterized protein n=1 Tax=Hypocrea atroviridis TaxID=63577 RepID=UPI0033324C44|nr:hypothetical protein TrAtP1_004490 [Trichoderma atroviride]